MQHNETLDNMRALTILAVVFGHTETAALAWKDIAPSNSVDIWIFFIKFIYTFHMPLFFIISGYLYGISHKATSEHPYCWEEGGILKFIKKKIFRLVIPYLSISVILICLKMGLETVHKFNTPTSPFSFVEMLYTNIAAPHLWFIFVLFTAFLIIPFFNSLKSRIFLLAASIILYYAPFNITEIFRLDSTKSFLIFFVAGTLIPNIYISSLNKAKKFSPYAMVLTLVISIIIYMNNDLKPLLFNEINTFGTLLFPIIGILGTLGVYYLSTQCRQVSHIQSCLGEIALASFPVFLFHNQITITMGLIVPKVVSKIPFFPVYGTMVFLFAFGISYAIYKIGKNYAWFCFLFGLPYTKK